MVPPQPTGVFSIARVWASHMVKNERVSCKAGNVVLNYAASRQRPVLNPTVMNMVERVSAYVLQTREPQEVAEAFTQLEKSGKVCHFGVSNQSPNQIKLLKSVVEQKLLFNQMQFSLMFTGMADAGINVNMKNENSIDHDNGILDYCRLKGITVQAWSPFQYGMFQGVFVGNEKFPEVNACLDEMAGKYKVSPSAIAAAWILRHPAHMQVVLGTTKVDRLRDIATSADIVLSRQDWYKLYIAAGNQLP